MARNRIRWNHDTYTKIADAIAEVLKYDRTKMVPETIRKTFFEVQQQLLPRKLRKNADQYKQGVVEAKVIRLVFASRPANGATVYTSVDEVMEHLDDLKRQLVNAVGSTSTYAQLRNRLKDIANDPKMRPGHGRFEPGKAVKH